MLNLRLCYNVRMIIKDTALIFEGGGMRASHTAGVVVTLLEEGIEFADVYGISAGSSHAGNYISRDKWRSRASFVEFFETPGAAGWGGFLLGRGYFNAEFIYNKACLPGEALPFDFETFAENPARIHIEAYERDTGGSVCWGKDDMKTMQDLMNRARASSTMPLFMRPVSFDGHVYLDGGIADSRGILLERAKKDGYKKFFIVLTQPPGYRKSPSKRPALIKALCGRHKTVAGRMLERYGYYNAILDEIDALEKDGNAYVFRPRVMLAKSTTLDMGILRENYALGYAQAQEELPAWRGFL